MYYVFFFEEKYFPQDIKDVSEKGWLYVFIVQIFEGTGILTISQASSLNGLHGEDQGVVTTKTELLGGK